MIITFKHYDEYGKRKFLKEMTNYLAKHTEEIKRINDGLTKEYKQLDLGYILNVNLVPNAKTFNDEVSSIINTPKHKTTFEIAIEDSKEISGFQNRNTFEIIISSYGDENKFIKYNLPKNALIKTLTNTLEIYNNKKSTKSNDLER